MFPKKDMYSMEDLAAPGLSKMDATDVVARGHRVPVRIGGGGLPFSPVYAPWSDPRQDVLYPPLPHARKRPDPRSGGFDVSRRDYDSQASRTESDAGWPGVADPQEVQAPEFGRRINIEQMELHAQLPGVEFVPFPQLTKTLVAPNANYVAQVVIPDTAQLVRLVSTVPAYVGRFSFALPLANGAGTDTYIDPIVLPQCTWFYCYGMRSLYLGLVALGDAASAMFYMTQ